MVSVAGSGRREAGSGKREAGSVTASRLALAIAFAAAAAVSPLGAQASAYVPLDDIAYRYVDALMARGQLPQLSILERPFTQRALHEAIDSARAREPGSIVSSYLDALNAAVEKYAVRPGNSDTVAAQTFRARGTGDFYVTAQSSGRRELMLADTLNDVRPGAAVRVVMAGGPVVGFTRVLIDSRLNVDPEYAGRKDRKINGRTEDGYVGGQWKYAELSLGRVGRNWGPPSDYGLMLGNYAYTYDHLYARIGSDRVHWSALITRLDDSLPPTGPSIERYFSIHRLAVQWHNVELAATESYLYAGPGRGFEMPLVNPLNVYALSWRNEREEGNLGLGGEIAVRTASTGFFAAQLFIDDLQIDRSCNPNCKQPSSYGLTFSADGLPLFGDQRWFASYTRVTNLAYNNKTPTEKYESFGVGLGRGFSDYDEARAGVDLAVLPRTPLRLYAAHRRQGQGGYTVPFPAPADYATTPGIFVGVVSGITRVALSGASRWRDFEISGDVGVNRVTNYNHVPGVTNTAMEGRIKLAVEPRWSISF